MVKAGWQWSRRWAPEIALAVLATAAFLGGLGSIELWGKREQRAVAEAIDTIDQGHWLVAQIQGRPRLEKPPLPRWTIASLMILTGRRDEAIARLPSALAAIGMVGLVYAIGRRMGGRSAGLASGLMLVSCVFFISEMRQAGNDGPLAFFVTLAIYAAWRRLHGGAEQAEGHILPAGDRLGRRGWATLFYVSLGLGFLTKGPVVLLLVVVALLPYLALARRLKAGSHALVDPAGMILFLLLALSWPVPVILSDPNAARVWYLEMAQKAGAAGVLPHRHREVLAAEWPGMMAPWSLIAGAAVLLPFGKRSEGLRPAVWLPWSWAMGNLAMFCLWTVAKPNYYVPCMPGAAILTGLAWPRLTAAARLVGPGTTRARRLLQVHWVVLFCVVTIVPVILKQTAPEFFRWGLVIAPFMALAVVLSARVWRVGGNARSMAPIAAAVVAFIMLGYGVIVPPLNPRHSHRELAEQIESRLPANTRTVMFFHEIDEGIWFYLRGHNILPVPGSQPRYNGFVDIEDDLRQGRFIADPWERVMKEKAIFVDWLRKPHPDSEYVLIKARDLDYFGPEVAALVQPLYRETGLKRNEIVLVRAPSPPPDLADGGRAEAARR